MDKVLIEAKRTNIHVYTKKAVHLRESLTMATLLSLPRDSIEWAEFVYPPDRSRAAVVIAFSTRLPCTTSCHRDTERPGSVNTNVRLQVITAVLSKC